MKTPTIHEAFIEAEQAYDATPDWQAARIKPGTLIFCHPDIDPPQIDDVEWMGAENYTALRHKTVRFSVNPPITLYAKDLYEAWRDAGYNSTAGAVHFTTLLPSQDGGKRYYLSGTRLAERVPTDDGNFEFKSVAKLRDLFNQPYNPE